MDQDAVKLRTALIERARKSEGEPIFYSRLVEVAGVRLILDLEEDRLRLIKLLTEIFLYEHNGQRPLLTILAIYKQTGDHGGEFYKLVTQYGYERDLRTNVAAMLKRFKAVIEFWCDDQKYELYKQV